MSVINDTLTYLIKESNYDEMSSREKRKLKASVIINSVIAVVNMLVLPLLIYIAYRVIKLTKCSN